MRDLRHTHISFLIFFFREKEPRENKNFAKLEQTNIFRINIKFFFLTRARAFLLFSIAPQTIRGAIFRLPRIWLLHWIRNLHGTFYIY